MSQPLSVEQAEEQLCALIDERFSPDRESPEGMREDWSLVNKAIDAMILAVRAEQQETVDTLKSEQSESDEVMFKALARAGEAEQQLAAALENLMRVRAERDTALDGDTDMAIRATVIAQVLRLVKAERETATDGTSIIEYDSLVAKIETLSMLLDPDLAVLSMSEREQALKEYAKAHIVKSCGMREEAEAHRDEARRLLKLPAQPTTEDAQ